MTRTARRPIGFAHRGSPALFQRENTVAAFQRALAGGAGGLESDVWLTADGVAVLHHDGVLGPPGRRRRLSETPAAALPGWLPRLAGLYAACGNAFELSLDLKDPPATARHAVRAVVETARAAGAADRLWLCGDLDAIRSWQSIISLEALDDTVKFVNSAASREIRSHRAIGGGLEAYARRAAAAGATVLNLRANDWSAAMVPLVHAHGLLAFGWHAQSSRALNRLLGFGVDGVYSDHLGRLVRATNDEATIARTRHVQ
ncbi:MULTISPECIES: glycerophosphodiester phosphodiesterase [unclassified Frankia]|uniref:glycerophosphodiester phosphodiesterase n=1 Tax=unclassified Frankia TaxID=2632575 RepID=UPI001EF5DE17|nr:MULTISPECIES: glycerophosphodiester phosphodiesterase [unclassified Frankia]